jgi:hypothetical protein
MNHRPLWGVVVTLVAYLGSASISHASSARDRNATTEAGSPAAMKPAEAPRLLVRVAPLVVLSPSDARGLVVVPRHHDNRLLRVILESEDYYSSSDTQLNGADAAQNHLLHWRQLPPGSYRVSVEVYGSTGLRDFTQAGRVVR